MKKPERVKCGTCGNRIVVSQLARHEGSATCIKARDQARRAFAKATGTR